MNMQRDAKLLVAFSSAALLAVLGCKSTDSRECAGPPPVEVADPHPMSEPAAYMVDNAMLEDMNMSDVHFVPHHAELNALGAKRLNRFAKILDVYGGTLRYDGIDESDSLHQARLEEIRRYLTSAGIDGDRFEVTSDIAGGKGMSGREALEIRVAARFVPGEESPQMPSLIGD